MLIALLMGAAIPLFIADLSDSQHKADPNRWACIYAVRGYFHAADRTQYNAVLDTAISLATSPTVKDGLRSYRQVAMTPAAAGAAQTSKFTKACDPYLPIDK